MPFNGILSALSLKKAKGGRKEGLAAMSLLTEQAVVPPSSSTLLDGHDGKVMTAQGVKGKKGIFGLFVTTEVTAAEQDDGPREVLPERSNGTSTSRIRLTLSKKDKGTKKGTKQATEYASRAAVPKPA
jgi:hypothetical protein